VSLPIVCLILDHQDALVGCGDPGPRVAYRNRERPVCHRRSDRDLALIGKFDRVSDQVEQDLRETALIAAADTTPCTMSPSE